MIHSASLLPSTAKFTLPFENRARQLIWPRIRRVFGPSSPDLTPCDFRLWGDLQDKLNKMNPHTL
jgi:hypothetical protein